MRLRAAPMSLTVPCRRREAGSSTCPAISPPAWLPIIACHAPTLPPSRGGSRPSLGVAVRAYVEPCVGACRRRARDRRVRAPLRLALARALLVLPDACAGHGKHGAGGVEHYPRPSLPL